MNNYRDRLAGALGGVSDADINAVTTVLSDARSKGARVWIVGNGGSATTADHFATDLSRCTDATGVPVRAMSLCSNQGILTATANDFGYEYIFIRQLQILGSAGDILIAISASGASPSIVDAILWAKENSIRSVAFTGFKGGPARAHADLSVHVPSVMGDYGVVEDVHLTICHMVAEALLPTS